MTLLEMLEEYNELLEAKDGLKEATKKNNEAIEAKKAEIAQQISMTMCQASALEDTSSSFRTKPSTARNQKRCFRQQAWTSWKS